MRLFQRKQMSGFSAVELLITLFVAATFLAAGYQLFNFIISDSGNTRAESSASNSAYDYLRRYTDSATNPCTAFTALSNQALTITGVDSPTVTVTLSCPQTDAPSLSKIEVAINYGSGSTATTVKHATFVDKSKGASPNVDVTNGLVGWWPFNGNANDNSGVGNNGTVNGATLTVGQNSQANNAYSFNGTSSNIAVPNSSSLQVGDTFSVSAWVYLTNISARYGIFSTRTANATGSWQLEIGTGNGGTGRVAVSGLSTWLWESNNGVINSNTWYHIVYVKAGNGTQGGSLYVNGASQSPLGTAAYTILNNSDPKGIGIGTQSGQYLPGSLDDVRLYNRALSASEVLQLYNGGAK